MLGSVKGISVLHFPKGKDIKEKGIFNIIDIRATLSELSKFSGSRHHPQNFNRLLKSVQYVRFQKD